jgi:N-acetylglutamate synthase-like GNAT family acetyltransferase
VTLVNFVVLKQYRDRGIASIVLGTKLNEWSSTFKTVVHSVLKASEQASFFERFGFKTVREDEIAYVMEANIA